MNFLKKILPWIGAAATGNVPALVSMAANAVSGALGNKVDSSVDSIVSAVQGATPEQLVALKQAELDFQAKMQAMGFSHEEELAQIEVADRDSARAREISVRDFMPMVLGGGVVAGFIVATFLILTGHGKADSVMAGTLIGYLPAKAELVLAYYFGSSAGSDRKTELLAQCK